jgi:glycosyltransferase involved in cell wall biosynthesis
MTGPEGTDVSTGTKEAFEQIGAGRPALIIRRGPSVYDSRILREADTLRRLGYRPLILGVVSDDIPETRDEQAGTPIIRLEPTSPFAWARSLQRKLTRRPQVTGADGPAADPGSDESPNPLMRAAIRVHRWIRTLDFYRRAIAVVRDVRPALVHCNDYNTMWVGVAARLMGGSTVVYDSHELWPDRNGRSEPRWWLIACEFLFVHLAHRTITASPGYSEVIARRYRIAPPGVIRNIPDASTLPSAVRAENGNAASDRLALYVGALTTGRGLELSIMALSHVDDVRLRLVGPARPAYLKELVALADREGVSDRVEFAGAVSSNELIEAISEASVGLALIQPICLSYRMSLPNKVFEYVAAGLPVLGSDLPAIGSLVTEHRIGLLAAPGEVEDVAAKLGEMLDPERNSSFREATREAARELNWDREAVRLADEYRAAEKTAVG